jgi:nitroreductase
LPGSCLDVISSHVSVRKFTRDPIPKEDLEKIIEAARRAPSSWNLLPVTITIVTDPEKKRRLAEATGGQQHVEEAPVFIVFSVDYYKLEQAARTVGVATGDYMFGHFVVGVLDVGIASGWAALAAEELGYGIVFVALYSNPCRIAEILGLPELVVPIVGLAVGKPAEKPRLRPRHPREAFVSENTYVEGGGLGEKVASTYGERASRLLSYVLSSDGYYERVTQELLNCIKQRGFKA